MNVELRVFNFLKKLISLIRLDRFTRRNRSLACYNTCLHGIPVLEITNDVRAQHTTQDHNTTPNHGQKILASCRVIIIICLGIHKLVNKLYNLL